MLSRLGTVHVHYVHQCILTLDYIDSINLQAFFTSSIAHTDCLHVSDDRVALLVLICPQNGQKLKFTYYGAYSEPIFIVRHDTRTIASLHSTRTVYSTTMSSTRYEIMHMTLQSPIDCIWQNVK